MSGSEEKTLPPSEKKLRDARKKGQIPQFNDITMVLAFGAGIIYLGLSGQSFLSSFSSGLRAAMTGLSENGSVLVAARVGSDMVQTGISLVVGLTAVTFLVRMITTVVLNKGFIFSLDPLSPKLSKLDPIKGLGRIFGVRGIVEVAKATAKMAFGIAIAWVFVRVFTNSVVQSVHCGLSCQFSLLSQIALVIFATYVIFGLILALPDLKLQSWLFSRDMKMSKSEQKRETKDMMGSPEIRSARNRLRQSMRGPSDKKIDPRLANLAIIGGRQITLLRYIKGETAVPMVIDMGADTAARELLADVEARDIPIYAHPDLSLRINTQSMRGGPIHETTYSGVADALAWMQRQ